MKVLIVEDDNKIITALTYCLQIVWPTIEIVSTRWGEEGINLAETLTPDVIILDLGLPDIDGLEVLKRLRLFSRIPVLVLTVNNDEASIVQALELGANDYVFKPFRQMELIARVKRLVVERMETESGAPRFFSCLTYDYSRRSITMNNSTIDLSCIENEIFNKLIKEYPHVVTYASLSKAVWGDYYDGSVDTLKVHVRHLRQKIEEEPGRPKIILTKVGVGYYLVKP